AGSRPRAPNPPGRRNVLTAYATTGAVTSQVRIRILGPLEVSGGGRPVPVTAPKQRAILALLAANAGRVVRVESLVTELWGDEPPKSAVANLRTYVMQLRKLLFSAGS